MVYAAFSLAFNISPLSYDCQILLVFLDPFALGFFGDFIPKGENVGPKQACGLSLQVVSRYETKGGECEHKDQKGGSLI
jgi:hypothetical protein